MIGQRLVVTFGFKAKAAVPKILYLGHDVDEAKAALSAAIDKGFWEIKVCRDIDAYFLHRWKSSAPLPAPVAKIV